MRFCSSVQIGVCILSLGFIWIQTDAQYETLNNLCGGYFRYITGNINFKFNETTTNRTDVEKLCMWTVAPTRQYVNFLVTQLDFPKLNCDDYSITINALEDRLDQVTSSTRYCRDAPPQMPFIIRGSVLVIILKVRSVDSAILTQGDGFRMNYTLVNESDYNNSTQLITTYYSYAQPKVLGPYFAAGQINNGFSTFGFPKANFSNGVNYEFQLTFDDVLFDYCYTPGVEPKDFLMVCPISPTGALSQPIIFRTNTTNTPTYKSGYGFFLIFWGSRLCPTGGGGKMQLYFDSVRIS